MSGAPAGTTPTHVPPPRPGPPRLSRLAAGAVALTGAVVLCDWVLDVRALKSVVPGLVERKVSTAK